MSSLSEGGVLLWSIRSKEKRGMTLLSLFAVFLRKFLKIFAAEFRTAGATTLIAIVAKVLMADLEGSVVTANRTGGVFVEANAILVFFTPVHSNYYFSGVWTNVALDFGISNKVFGRNGLESLVAAVNRSPARHPAVHRQN